MDPRFKNKFAIGATALAAAAFAGGAYAATEAGSTSREAFLNDVAKRLNVAPAALQAALKGAFLDQLNAAVAAGTVTQAQAAAIRQRIEQGKLPFLFGPRGMGPGQFVGGLRRDGAMEAAAKYLGLSDAQLLNELRGGKSLAQIASSRGKTTAGLKQAMIASIRARLDRAVSAGRITKAQEQQLLSRIALRIGRRVTHTGPRVGRLHSLYPVPPLPLGGPPGPPPGGPPGPPPGPQGPPPGGPGPPPGGPPPAA